MRKSDYFYLPLTTAKAAFKPAILSGEFSREIVPSLSELITIRPSTRLVTSL